MNLNRPYRASHLRSRRHPAVLLLGGLLLASCTPPPAGPVEPIPGLLFEEAGDGTPARVVVQDFDIDAPPAAHELPPGREDAWRSIVPGLERRIMPRLAPDGGVLERVHVLRADPELIRLDIEYSPGKAKTLDRWLADSGALAVVNGGYFTEELYATGLLIADGQSHGASYGGFAGMLAVGPDGFADLRWLEQRPYDPAEPLSAALQSFPVLVKPGGVHGFPEDGGLPARRTVVARDSAGRFLFLVAPGGSFPLHGLATWLVDSDLEIDIALNLDGGTSSGLLVASPPEGTPGFVAVPSAITLHAR